ncbi:MAG: TonB-dependent receptor [Opitutaceae bacterium]
MCQAGFLEAVSAKLPCRATPPPPRSGFHRCGVIANIGARLPINSAGIRTSAERTGGTERYGIEFASFYRALPWLAFDADFALTHARYEDAPGADRIPNSPATVVTGGVVVDLPRGIFGTVRARYFGPQPLIEDNSVEEPSSLTFNARLGWRVKDWEIAVDVLNLLDRRNNDIAYFYGSRLPGEPLGGIDDTHAHPAEPRTVRVSIARRF